MEKFLVLFILFPLAGFLLSLLLPRRKEQLLSGLAIGVAALQLAGATAFTVYWLLKEHPFLEIKQLVVYRTSGFEFFIDFCFDKISAAWMLTGGVIALLVMIFSRYYIHREEGFKRFFSTVLLFYAGFHLVILAGNFETLFIGWELLGISSFLLIAFYRDRYLPVKNALKVLSVYRLGDICLILAMWMMHHVWEGNITFSAWHDSVSLTGIITAHPGQTLFIALMILAAVLTKSAQFPFSSWFPRALEGPTSSSAVFYGSLASHLGIFLLLRTHSFWSQFPAVKIAIIALGAVTGLLATLTARVQPTVKTQIAYASVAQMGLMMIEVALGFYWLAMIHFAGNAFLRTYQLLVSPSVLHYLIHDQFFHFSPRSQKTGSSFVLRIRNTIFMLAVKEWNLDAFLYRSLWNPFKITGKQLNFLATKVSGVLLVAVLLSGILGFTYTEMIPGTVAHHLPGLYAVIAFALVLKSFTERASALRGWTMASGAQFFLGIAISLNARPDFGQLLLFFGGITAAAVLGIFCLFRLKKEEENILLNRFHGNVFEHRGLAMLFFIACLGLLGFPVTSSFLGIDLFFTYIHEDQYVLIIFSALTIALIELSVLRMFARLFLGQHKKTYHPVAYRSS